MDTDINGNSPLCEVKIIKSSVQTGNIGHSVIVREGCTPEELERVIDLAITTFTTLPARIARPPRI